MPSALKEAALLVAPSSQPCPQGDTDEGDPNLGFKSSQSDGEGMGCTSKNWWLSGDQSPVQSAVSKVIGRTTGQWDLRDLRREAKELGCGGSLLL